MDAATETLLAAITAALADFTVEIADPRDDGTGRRISVGKVWTYTARVAVRDEKAGTISVTVDQDGILTEALSHAMLMTARAKVREALTAAGISYQLMYSNRKTKSKVFHRGFTHMGQFCTTARALEYVAK